MEKPINSTICNKSNAMKTITIDTIKKKYKALDNRMAWVEKIAPKLGKSAVYLQQNYFQAKWKIPANELFLINSLLDAEIDEKIKELKAL